MFVIPEGLEEGLFVGNAEDNGVVPLSNTAVFTFVVQHPVRFTYNTYTFELVKNNNPFFSDSG